MNAILALFLLALVAAILLKFSHMAIKELRRAPQTTTNLQRRLINDSRERASWEMFICALSAQTIPELRDHMK